MKKIGLLAGMLAFSTAYAADGVTTGGYVDAQWNWSKSGAFKENGFNVPEGAIYINGSVGDSKAMIDVPFMMGSTTTNTMTLGMDKAQAWVEHWYDNGFHWKMGQFDSIYGSEGKDSADIPFTDHSMITKTVMPWTHTGLLMGYMVNEDWDLDLMIANPNSAGMMTSGTPEFGLRLKGSFKDMGVDEFTGAFKMGNSGGVKPWMASGILGLHFGDIVMRGDGFMSNSGVSGSKTAMGIGGYTLFNVNESTAAGVRFGLASGQSSTQNKMEVTVGPQFKTSKNLTAKVDYTLGVLAGPASTKTHGFAVAGVYKF